MADSTRRRFIADAAVGAIGATLGGAAWAGGVPLKVGIVHSSALAAVGWVHQHELARQAMEAGFPGRISTTVVENVSQPQDSERVFRRLAVEGHALIFGTSFSHMSTLLKVARAMPKTCFEHCSGLRHLNNLGTFEARYYEGTYLAGLIAGSMTRTKTIGFVAGFPIPDVIGMINGLVLGAQSVNPAVTARVVWLNSWYEPGREKSAAQALIDQGADVLVSLTDTPVGVQTGESRGVWTVGYASDMSRYGPKHQLTSFMVDWSSIYIGAARDMLAGNWSARERWEGLRTGVVKMGRYNAAIPKSVVELATEKQRDMAEGRLHPFAGPIRDQQGRLVVNAGEHLSDVQIRAMNWFTAGNQGVLPKV